MHIVEHAYSQLCCEVYSATFHKISTRTRSRHYDWRNACFFGKKTISNRPSSSSQSSKKSRISNKRFWDRSSNGLGAVVKQSWKSYIIPNLLPSIHATVKRSSNQSGISRSSILTESRLIYHSTESPCRILASKRFQALSDTHSTIQSVVKPWQTLPNIGKRFHTIACHATTRQ